MKGRQSMVIEIAVPKAKAGAADRRSAERLFWPGQVTADRRGNHTSYFGVSFIVPFPAVPLPMSVQ
jgi:hypothetical protein